MFGCKKDQVHEPNMKYLRDKLGINQEEAAKILGSSRKTVSRCETERIEPKFTLAAHQKFANMIKAKTKVDILTIPGFEYSTDKGRELFELIEKSSLDD
jgi:DNA-binding XRE family transcriptional regulator